jgi:diguanylate cyclase (GGDEF)-like protein
MLCELDADKAESASQANRVAEKIRGALAMPYRLVGKPGETIEHRCTASIGVVLFANHEATLDEIIKWADLEMYRAKDEGRDRVCLAR